MDLRNWQPAMPKGWIAKKGGSNEDMPNCSTTFIFLHKHGLAVFIDCSLREDNKAWIHISLSRKNRMPDWLDIVKVKEDFLGPNVYAYIILPPKSKYVNIHKYVLNIYAPLDGLPVLPEFSYEINLGEKTVRSI